MTVTNLFDRRYFVKLAGAAPLLAYIAAHDMAEKAWGAVGKHAGKENVYSRIGVRPCLLDNPTGRRSLRRVDDA